MHAVMHAAHSLPCTHAQLISSFSLRDDRRAAVCGILQFFLAIYILLSNIHVIFGEGLIYIYGGFGRINRI